MDPFKCSYLRHKQTPPNHPPPLRSNGRFTLGRVHCTNSEVNLQCTPIPKTKPSAHNQGKKASLIRRCSSSIERLSLI